MAKADYERYLSPTTRRALRLARPTRPKPERRKNTRIKIDELNKMGAGELRTRVEKLKEKEDRRPWYVKALDVIDVPRNIVANVIGDIAGVDKSKARKGTLMKKVYMSDVLGKLGWKPTTTGGKVAKGVAGFIGDVAIDPLLYWSTAARTARPISSGLGKGARRSAVAPKLIRPGVKEIVKGGRAIAAGKAVPAELTKALTAGRAARISKWTKQFVKTRAKKVGMGQAQKEAGQRLAAKRGGLLERTLGKALEPRSVTKQAGRRLEGAAGFMRKYGERGKTMLRAPFGKRGLTLPFGKAARKYKGLSDPNILKRMMETGGLYRKGKAATVRGAARRTGKLFAEPLAAAKKAKEGGRIRKIRIQSAMAVEKAKEAARAQKFPAAEKMGEFMSRISDPAEHALIKGRGTGQWGTTALRQLPAEAGALARMKHGIQRFKRGVVGQEPTVFGMKQHATLQRAVIPPAAMGARKTAELQQRLTPLAKELATKTGIAQPEIHARILNLMEKTAKLPRGEFDPGLKMLLQTTGKMAPHKAAAIGADPRVKGLVAELRKYLDDIQLAAEKARVPGAGPVPGFVPRMPAEGVPEAALAQEMRMGAQPWTQPRRMVQDVRLPKGEVRAAGEVRPALVGPKPAEDITRLLKGGDLPAGSVPTGDPYAPFTQQYNVWSKGEGPTRPIFGPHWKGEQFETNIPKLMGEYTRRAEQQKQLTGLGRQLAPLGVKLPPGMAAADPRFANLAAMPIEKSHPLYRFLAPYTEGKVFPAPVVETTMNYIQKFKTPEAAKKFLKGADWFYDHWKALALIHPAYTIRNAAQGIIGTAQAGGSIRKMGQRTFDKDIWRIRQAVETGAPLDNLSVMVGGRQIPAKAYASSGKMLNMFNARLTSDLMRPGFNPQNLLRKGYAKFFHANNAMETQMRLGLWTSLMDDGMGATEAAMKVIKAMPDLSDLTVIEKGFFRRIFPWYSWMRRNGALQLEYLMKEPGWIAGGGKLRQALEQMTVGQDQVPQDLRPEWMNEQQAAQIAGTNEDGYAWLLASWLPFQDIVKIGTGAMSLKAGARYAMEQMRPELKFMAEMATGHDIFKGREVGDIAGPVGGMLNIPRALAGASATPLDSLMGVRPIRETKRIWQMPTLGGKIGRGILGGAIQPVSKRRGLASESTRLRELVMDLRRRMNRAKESGDAAEYQELLQQWMKAQMRRRRLGLPGVPKSTGAVMGQAGIEAGPPAFPD